MKNGNYIPLGGEEEQRIITFDYWTLQVKVPKPREVQEESGPPKRDKKKVLVSTWKNLDSFESNEEEGEEANLCLMAYLIKYLLDDFNEELDFSNRFVVQAYNEL